MARYDPLPEFVSANLTCPGIFHIAIIFWGKVINFEVYHSLSAYEMKLSVIFLFSRVKEN